MDAGRVHMGGQTGLRPLRRRVLVSLLTGLGALGASAFVPRLVRSGRAASPRGDGSSSNGEVAPRDANKSDDLPRAALYDEDPGDPNGRKFPGVAVWALIEKADDRSGLLETLVRANVAIPDHQMVMSFMIRRNDDKSLPASHTVEFTFTLPPDAPRHIGNVPGILMKSREDARGVPLRGYGVKVTDGFYLIGLSAVESELTANLRLLTELEWFDVPIVYSDGRRAILAFEKGEPGRRALAQALATWDGPPRHAPPPEPPPRLQLPPDIIK
jgi:hypothetical protein